jgi:hypothetical protein
MQHGHSAIELRLCLGSAGDREIDLAEFFKSLFLRRCNGARSPRRANVTNTFTIFIASLLFAVALLFISILRLSSAQSVGFRLLQNQQSSIRNLGHAFSPNENRHSRIKIN